MRVILPPTPPVEGISFSDLAIGDPFRVLPAAGLKQDPTHVYIKADRVGRGHPVAINLRTGSCWTGADSFHGGLERVNAEVRIISNT